jgi:uncharacterized membrane protein YfcA
MKYFKIVLSHLVLWLVVSSIAGAILGPKININNIDDPSNEMPVSVLVVSVLYFLIGWLIPYRYFNKEKNESENNN